MEKKKNGYLTMTVLWFLSAALAVASLLCGLRDKRETWFTLYLRAFTAGISVMLSLMNFADYERPDLNGEPEEEPVEE